MKKFIPHLVAIVGGSGAGKTWLGNAIQKELGGGVARLSLDSFYLDRSNVARRQREKINFDDPAAIDWTLLAAVLEELVAGRPAQVPIYDFATHTRATGNETLSPEPLILVEGLWLLRERTIRGLFDLTIFIDCPESIRFTRPLARVVAERNRTPLSIRKQFLASVKPMHKRHVESQKHLADMVFSYCPGESEIRDLAGQLRKLATKVRL